MNTTSTFKEQAPSFDWHGNLDIIQSDNEWPPHSAVTIHVDSESKVQVNWETEGWLNFLLSGEWVVELWLEKAGHGKVDWPDSNVRVSFVSKPHSYSEEIIIPSGLLTEGLYWLTASLSLAGWEGLPGHLAGVVDKVFVKVVNEKLEKWSKVEVA